LVNDLTLAVRTSSGQEFHGNFSGPQQPGTNLDSTNNVEQVVIETPDVGICRVIVSGVNVPTNIPGGTGQDFSLVARGHLVSTLKAIQKFPDNPGPLDAAILCNKLPPFNPIKGEGPLRKGDDRKELVKHLQRMLLDLGFNLGTSGENKDGIDGIFGERTEKAVEDFQAKNKDWEGNQLRTDRTVGPMTSDALNRNMVGRWYDKYETPKELTQDTHVVTLTERTLEESVSLNPTNLRSARLIVLPIVGSRLITLLDPLDNRFSFEGEADFDVLDKQENTLAKGKIRNSENITLQDSDEPATVELKVQNTFFTFFVQGDSGSGSSESK
jgi:hypothetical protein